MPRHDRKIGRLLEPETSLVHYESPPGMDCVTLCQISDWLGVARGEPTAAPVTCQPCRWIMDFCRKGVI